MSDEQERSLARQTIHRAVAILKQEKERAAQVMPLPDDGPMPGGDVLPDSVPEP